MKKIALIMLTLFIFNTSTVVFVNAQSKTDEQFETYLILEKLNRTASAFERIVGQKNFYQATQYTYGLLLNTIAKSPVGSSIFLHGASVVGVFEITVSTQVIDGQSFRVGRLSYKKNLLAVPLYETTLLWDNWNNKNTNKYLTLTIFSNVDKDMFVSRSVRFKMTGDNLGNPVFIFRETFGGDLHRTIGTAIDTNQDGVVDFISITEKYLTVEKTTVATKLPNDTLWTHIKICENGVCKKLNLGEQEQ